MNIRRLFDLYHQSLRHVRHWKLAAVFLLATIPMITIAQIYDPKYADYFLVGQFGEVCTMCEVVVLCEATDTPPKYASIPTDGSFTLYHLQTRTFWSQVSTIWEWFIRMFSTSSLAARGHTRPVHVYGIEEGIWSVGDIIEGRLILEPGLLEFGEKNIDRVTHAWIDRASGKNTGYCQRMSLWDSLADIESNTSVETKND